MKINRTVPFSSQNQCPVPGTPIPDINGSGPGGDHPDETFAIDSGSPPFESLFISDQSAIILKGSFSDNLISLINRIKSSYVEADVDSSVMDLLESSKLLIIPSGGLMGLETSEFFKASLDEYVKQGGTLVVFAQQHGYEFSALPVPVEADGTKRQVRGYGWTEDTSCFTNAVYMDSYHQMLAGQTRSTPTLSVDGYFTDYPSSATVILRRTVNGQPAMITYPLGNGRVVVTSMYTDWAYGHSQASPEEVALVRDLIAWAKHSVQLPETTLGGQVALDLSLVNNTSIDAASGRITVLDPDRKVIYEETVASSVTAGASAAVVFTYSTPATAAVGIWHVDYTLLDAQGNVIQPQAETDSGRFAVSNPPANPYKSPDFGFSVQSDGAGCM